MLGYVVIQLRPCTYWVHPPLFRALVPLTWHPSTDEDPLRVPRLRAPAVYIAPSLPDVLVTLILVERNPSIYAVGRWFFPLGFALEGEKGRQLPPARPDSRHGGCV